MLLLAVSFRKAATWSYQKDAIASEKNNGIAGILPSISRETRKTSPN